MYVFYCKQLSRVKGLKIDDISNKELIEESKLKKILKKNYPLFFFKIVNYYNYDPYIEGKIHVYSYDPDTILLKDYENLIKEQNIVDEIYDFNIINVEE